MNGGSRYVAGETLSVVGVATTTGHTIATVDVASIYDHTNEVVKIDGILNQNYSQYNNLYRIVNVSGSKSIQVASAGTITPQGISTTTGLGATITSNSYVYLTGKSLQINAFDYDSSTGIATVRFAQSHGLSTNEKIRISGANQSLYNGDFIVSENVGLSTVKVDIGISTSSPTATGTIIIHPFGYASKEGDNSGIDAERIISQYAGICTTIGITNITSVGTAISITSIDKTGLRIGDYIQVDDEIMRINSTVNENPVSVFRGVLGTRNVTHSAGSVVKKIHTYPIEFRRHSILRASSHTFEYVGFGPGNYSNAFHDRQDRQITEQE